MGGRLREGERLLLSQDKVHNPASSNMVTRLAAVGKDAGIVAAHFFQGVGKDGETGFVECPRRKASIIVGGLCEGQHGRGEPSGGD